MKGIIGWVLIALMFIGIFQMIQQALGRKDAVTLFGAVFGMAGMIALVSHFISLESL